ncbi:hypothetical protein QTP88_010960 [Uroleucon formosanum]
MHFNNEEFNNSNDIINAFAKYFSSVFENYGFVKSIDHNPPKVLSSPLHSVSIDLIEVFESIYSLVSTSSPGPDLIPNIFLRNCKNIVGSSSSDANENICISPTNSVSLKRANSTPNKQSDTATSDTTVSKRRKYDENYISFGFIHENSYPQCVVCSKVFPNSSMVPAKLRSHLETNHTNVKDKPIDYFIRLRDQLLKNKNFIAEVTKTANEKATEASYMVSYRIAQAGKAHTIAESLIKPCVTDIVSCMLDEKVVKKINTIPLFNDTVGVELTIYQLT